MSEMKSSFLDEEGSEEEDLEESKSPDSTRKLLEERVSFAYE